jgi:hypothetical protein
VRKNIGYFEGTDSILLTRLVCAGYDTLPISNGYDNHGANVRLIDGQNRYDLLVGYIHKIFAPDTRDKGSLTYQDLFHLCKTYGVPLLLEVPAELHDTDRALLKGAPESVQFVDPDDMFSVALELLSDG